MKRPHLKISWKKALLYLIPLPVMVLMNLSLPMREPVSLSLAYALMACGLDPFILSAEYVLASAPALSLAASLASLLQGLLLAVSFALLARAKRKPLWIKLLLLAAAQLPFLFLYPHAGYAAIPLPVLLQKLILSLFLILLSLLFEGAVRALLFRAFRCRLMAAELSELVLLWFFTGLGLYALGGDIPYLFVTLLLLLIAVIGMKNATAVPFALVLSAPLCAATMSVVPAAEYALLACAGLLFSSYGSIVTALSVFLAFLGVQYFEGLFAGSALEISLTLCACFIPAALCAILPERTVKRLRRSLLFYRERALPRIAINRNRRAVGEQLYEVSSLFREIEAAFTAESDSAQGRRGSGAVE